MIFLRFFLFSTLFFLSDLCAEESALISESPLLQLAEKNNDNDLVEILMKYGTDPSHPALNRAMEDKNYLAVQILIEYGVDMNSRKEEYQLIETVTQDPHSRTNSTHSIVRDFGATVLENAIELKRLELIEYFLLNNIDPLCHRKMTETTTIYTYGYRTVNTKKYETTAVYDAIKSGNLDIILLFHKYGADLNAICYQEYSEYKQIYRTAMQTAIDFHQREIVAYLISIGMKI